MNWDATLLDLYWLSIEKCVWDQFEFHWVWFNLELIKKMSKIKTRIFLCNIGYLRFRICFNFTTDFSAVQANPSFNFQAWFNRHDSLIITKRWGKLTSLLCSSSSFFFFFFACLLLFLSAYHLSALHLILSNLMKSVPNWDYRQGLTFVLFCLFLCLILYSYILLFLVCLFFLVM